MLQDGPPRRVVARTAAMALVHNDEIEEVPWIVAEDTQGIAAVGHGLVESEVDLACGVGVARDLPDGVAEHRLELAGDRLVDQDVAFSDMQNPRLSTLHLHDVLDGRLGELAGEERS